MTRFCISGKNNPSYKHGNNMRGKRTTEYEIWAGIRKRCLNKNDKLYPYYGGRGIKICDRWKNDFLNFLQDVGSRPSKNHSLDRIDNEKEYSKNNCRWSTRSEQSRNKRNNINVIYKKEKMCLKDFCLISGCDYKKVWRRYRTYKMNIEDASGVKGVCIG